MDDLKETEPTDLAIVCMCRHPHHTIVLTHDPDFGHTITSQENRLEPFWRRLKVAARYLFRLQDVCWHETMVTKEDLKKFKKWMSMRTIGE